MVQRHRGILMILLAVGDHGDHDVCRFNGLVVMISVLHTEGPEFDPQLNHPFWRKWDVGTDLALKPAMCNASIRQDGI